MAGASSSRRRQAVLGTSGGGREVVLVAMTVLGMEETSVATVAPVVAVCMMAIWESLDGFGKNGSQMAVVDVVVILAVPTLCLQMGESTTGGDLGGRSAGSCSGKCT